MSNFTKDYIREADCEEIQKQKAQLDYCCEVALKTDNEKYEEKIYRAFAKGINNKYLLCSNWDDVVSGIYGRSRIVWLPTGDQLTEEILKRCYVYNLNLECFSEHYCKKPNCQKWGISIEADNHVVNHEFNREVWNKDILIAKIKLLKELLK